MNANDQCNRCGIDRDVHDLRPAPDHAFVEPAQNREPRAADPCGSPTCKGTRAKHPYLHHFVEPKGAKP